MTSWRADGLAFDRQSPAGRDRGAAPPGVEVHGYVDELYRHLAASDLAIVHGGLSTCMELAASRTPFLYFPLHNHFEQDRHVDYRLKRYRA